MQPAGTGHAGGAANPALPTSAATSDIAVPAKKKPAKVVPPQFGVSVPGVPATLGALHGLEASLQRTPAIVMWYEQWADAPSFPAAGATAIARGGSEPEITWEPWDPFAGLDQPSYSLASITQGSHDAYIRRWATEIKAWGRPLRLRFAQEMNGSWYPWDEGVNGNGPGSYVAAWRHVHDIFTSVGVTNVSWIWSPSTVYDGSTPLRELWPGDRYVDFAAVDGYNWGTSMPGKSWQSFAQIFGETLTNISKLTSRPELIGEVGSTSIGGSKGLWITGMFKTLKATSRVRGFTWFDWNKETDWSINSSPSSLAAFRAGLNGYLPHRK